MKRQDLDFFKSLYSKNSRLNHLARTKLVCPPVLADDLHEVALNLSVPEVNILAALENKLGLNPQNSAQSDKNAENLCLTQIAALLGFSKATISVAVERLVKKCLVERYYLNNNRKTTYIRLTPLGKELGENEDLIHAKYFKTQLDRYASKEQIFKIDDAYNTLIEIFSQFDNTK